jgi:hypothetical protein
MQVMGGNCGGIIASYVYLSRDGPRFITGHSILIGFVRYVKTFFSDFRLLTDTTSMAFGLTLFMSTWCRMENKRRDRVAAEGGSRDLTEEEILLEKELADSVPWFRYTV